jgi:hypothetical protein
LGRKNDKRLKKEEFLPQIYNTQINARVDPFYACGYWGEQEKRKEK